MYFSRFQISPAFRPCFRSLRKTHPPENGSFFQETETSKQKQCLCYILMKNTYCAKTIRRKERRTDPFLQQRVDFFQQDNHSQHTPVAYRAVFSPSSPCRLAKLIQQGTEKCPWDAKRLKLKPVTKFGAGGDTEEDMQTAAFKQVRNIHCKTSSLITNQAFKIRKVVLGYSMKNVLSILIIG